MKAVNIRLYFARQCYELAALVFTVLAKVNMRLISAYGKSGASIKIGVAGVTALHYS